MQIDAEFQALIPPLSQEEKAQLEANIVADGCRDPLVVWPLPVFTVDYSDAQDGSDMESYVYAEAQHHSHYTQDEGVSEYKTWGNDEEVGEKDWPCLLLDGHNRFEICTRLVLPYDVVLKEFASREDSIEWIIHNQFGRRNLSDYQRGVLALRMKPIIEARAKAKQALAGGDKKSDEAKSLSLKSDKAITPIRTDETIAVLANLGKDTIRKVEQIENTAAPEIKALAASGNISINLVAQFIALTEAEQQEALAAIKASQEPPKEIIREAISKAHVANNSGNNEWYTPARYIELARTVIGGIDTDPASSEIANRLVKAKTIFTAAEDGRDQIWHGRVWLNPPYAQPLINEFIEAVTSKYESGEITEACVVVNNATETQWGQRLLSCASAVCFLKSRIKFLDPEGNATGAPLQGQAIFYMGDCVDAFLSACKSEGIAGPLHGWHTALPSRRL